ncbi:MAG: Acg family FMN-binding oxidoreductase [Bacteroidota bacterium]
MTLTVLCAMNAHAQNHDFLKIAEYGTKAPSGHNTQPWKFKLLDSCIDIYPNFDYSLPVVDPEDRELYISLGAAAENIAIAARHFGYSPSIETEKISEKNCRIRVVLRKDSAVCDSLFFQIDKRQTNRGVYNGNTIPQDTVEIIKQIRSEEGVSLHIYRRDEPFFDTLKNYVIKGNEIQMEDNSFKEELKSWIRYNGSQAEETSDGLTNKVMGSPSVPKILGKFIIDFFLTPGKQNKSDTAKIMSSSHFVLFTVKNNNIEDWISLGRSLEIFLLKTTELGIANAYMNQPCEIVSLSRRLAESLKTEGEYPALLLRIGYCAPAPYSPRRPVAAAIIK